MDILRSCYITNMRFPGGVVQPVRWYFTDKAPLPFATVYNSRNWLKDKKLVPDFGEVPGAPRKWVNGSPPGNLHCTGPQGSPAAFAGAPGPPLFSIRAYVVNFKIKWARNRNFLITAQTSEWHQTLWRLGRKFQGRPHFSPHYGTRWRRGRDWFAIKQTVGNYVSFWERGRTWEAIPATVGRYASTWSRARSLLAAESWSEAYAPTWSRARSWLASESWSEAYAPTWSRARSWLASESWSEAYAPTWSRARAWDVISQWEDNVITYTCGSLVALGGGQAGAAAIATDTVIMTSTGTPQGCRLPAGCHRVVAWNNNSPGGNPILVYPPSGAKIGAGATDAGFTVLFGQKWLFVEMSSTQWWTVQLS